MSQAKTRRTSWVGWLISAILIVGSLTLWTQRQNVVDAIQYYQYTPSEAVREVTATTGMTDDAEFTFYATRPAIESKEAFNLHCTRKEAKSPILGCYASNRIFIYDVTDQRTSGIKAVTAAHELLHAEWDRLPSNEQSRVKTLLEKAYKPGEDPKLDARMEYYERTEPGQAINELHSIIGTEVESISPELEKYYAKYFNDRSALVALHQQVNSSFDALSKEADNLVAQIEKLALTINNDTKTYNQGIESLNSSIVAFNARANNSEFRSQAEFQVARNQLIREGDSIAEFRQRIQSNIAEYKTLLAKLDTLNAESVSLNESIDSTLSDAPKI